MAEGAPESLGGPGARTPLVTWTADGVRHTERTDAPTALAAHLMATVAGADGEVPDLCITRPSLEDVYLELTESE